MFTIYTYILCKLFFFFSLKKSTFQHNFCAKQAIVFSETQPKMGGRDPQHPRLTHICNT